MYFIKSILLLHVYHANVLPAGITTNILDNLHFKILSLISHKPHSHNSITDKLKVGKKGPLK